MCFKVTFLKVSWKGYIYSLIRISSWMLKNRLIIILILIFIMLNNNSYFNFCVQIKNIEVYI